MARIGTRKLILEIDGTEYSAEVSKAVVTSGEGDTDFLTFADARAGGKREYRLEFTAAQDAATAANSFAPSLWSMVFNEAGSDVPITIAPYGNAVPTATEPHFTAIATISEPDGDFLGGEADISPTAAMLFECSWVLAAKPVKVI